MEEVAVDRRGKAVCDGSGCEGLEPTETPRLNLVLDKDPPKLLGFQKAF